MLVTMGIQEIWPLSHVLICSTLGHGLYELDTWSKLMKSALLKMFLPKSSSVMSCKPD